MEKWHCNNCGEDFNEPDEEEICLEDEYGAMNTENITVIYTYVHIVVVIILRR